MPRTVWPYSEVGHNQDAVRDLQGYFGVNPFPSPKPVKLLRRVLQVTRGDTLDFLAGSGTTADAVIRSNRDEDERRRFLLAEMGDHFDTVLLPRVQKVMYAPDWKDGKPKTQPDLSGTLGREAWPAWVERSPRLVRVLRLESYDDALHNLAAVAEDEPVERRAAAVEKLVGSEAYRLRYLFRLPAEAAPTALAQTPLAHPFGLTVETLTETGPEPRAVDLAETAVTLLGLRVRRVRTFTHQDRTYRVVYAREKADDTPVVLVLRDTEAPSPLDVAAERAFLEADVLPEAGPGARVLMNGAQTLPAAGSLDVHLHAALVPAA